MVSQKCIGRTEEKIWPARAESSGKFKDRWEELGQGQKNCDTSTVEIAYKFEASLGYMSKKFQAKAINTVVTI